MENRVVILLLFALASEVCCMTDFLKPEHLDTPNGTEISTKLSTFVSNQPHTESYSANIDQYHSQSGEVLPWYQSNIRPKGNYSSENIQKVDPNSRVGFTDLNFKPLPYDSRVTGQNIPNGHNGHQNVPVGQWFNNFHNQRYFQNEDPHYDYHYGSTGHIQDPHPFRQGINLWKPTSFGTQYPIHDDNSAKNNLLKSNYPLASFNNDIYHRPDFMKYDGYHQTHNSHNINNYHKLSNFMSDTHHPMKDFHPHNRDIVNSRSSHSDSGANFGYPAYNPLNFRGSYDEILGRHKVGSVHDDFVGMSRPGAERFSFESMLTKEDLESLIFDFYEPGNILMMNEEDSLDDRMGFSKKRSTGSTNGFKYYLDKFIKKTENIVSKWGPKIEKVSDAVGMVFGFLKYVSNLPVFHLHR